MSGASLPPLCNPWAAKSRGPAQSLGLVALASPLQKSGTKERAIYVLLGTYLNFLLVQNIHVYDSIVTLELVLLLVMLHKSVIQVEHQSYDLGHQSRELTSLAGLGRGSPILL